MLELKIDLLELNIVGAAGHEHRLQPIALRAVDILADRLSACMDGQESLDSARVRNLHANPIDLQLSGMSDDQAADAIAAALLDSLALKLKA